MTYVGAEQVLCDIWVRQRLASIALALEVVSEGLSQRIYQDYAPKDAAYPVIIYQCQDPPREVRGVGTFAVMVDTLYLVKAVAQVDSYDPLAPVVSLIHGAMTTSVGDDVQDGSVFTSIRERQFALPEVEEGVQFRHLGGTYRLQAQG